jgi:hypothetical protein
MPAVQILEAADKDPWSVQQKLAQVENQESEWKSATA